MMRENFNEEMYDEERLYSRAVSAGVIVAIIGLIFGVLSFVAMAVSMTQSEGIKGLLYTILAGVPAMVIVAVAFFVFTGGLVYGWKFFTPLFDFVGWFLFLPIVGWLIFFAIKFVVSISIGWIFFAYQVVIRWIDKIRDKKEKSASCYPDE